MEGQGEPTPLAIRREEDSIYKCDFVHIIVTHFPLAILREDTRISNVQL